MKAIRKILFPTDFSECAKNAFLTSLIFAEKTGADINVLHVVPPEYEALDMPVMAMQATKDRVENARTVVASFIKFGLGRSAIKAPQFKITSEVEIGGISDTIIGIAERDECDLIVLGTNSEHGRLERFLGSVASTVVANANCHVMVIPEDAEPRGFKFVGYASDLHKTDPFLIWEAARIIEPFNPIINCVHVNTGEEERPLNIVELDSFFDNKAPGLQINFKEMKGEEVWETLNLFAEQLELDLLIMSSPHRNLIERMFHRSITRKMTIYSKVPLLIVRE